MLGDNKVLCLLGHCAKWEPVQGCTSQGELVDDTLPLHLSKPKSPLTQVWSLLCVTVKTPPPDLPYADVVHSPHSDNKLFPAGANCKA